MKFERLDPKKHQRKLFNCGVISLNLYLQQFANQDQKRGLTQVYVLAEQQHIIGYYSICAYSVPTDQLPNNSKLGALGMIVDAKDEKAAGFYQKFGFKPLSASKN